MARRKTPPSTLQTKHVLAERIMSLRIDLYGPRGGPELARRLGIPVRTWYNYEGGITVPGEILLRVIEVTSVDPMWLLHGTGPRFSDPRREPSEPGPSSATTAGALAASALKQDATASSNVAVCTLLRAALRLLDHDQAESSEYDGTSLKPREIDGPTASLDPQLQFSERNAHHYARSPGNGTGY